ncbi:MAG: type IV pilus modification protein PilV [Haliea sp.]|jgi:type IV pilus assembly protein PilV|nr:type IV pilus modification protein PilV [Haliea sp.]
MHMNKGCRERASVQRRYSQGFTLIEVLVALLVLTVGALGVIGVQLRSFEANRGALYRTQATSIATELLDQMRANRAALNSYLLTVSATQLSGIPTAPDCATSNTGCTPEQSAALDLRQWGQHFTNLLGIEGYRTTLPSAEATVTRNGDEYTVTVAWSERAWDDTNATDGSTSRSNASRFVSMTSVIQP